MSQWWDSGASEEDRGGPGSDDGSEGDVRVDQRDADAQVERLLKNPALPKEVIIAAKDFNVHWFIGKLREQSKRGGRAGAEGAGSHGDADSEGAGSHGDADSEGVGGAGDPEGVGGAGDPEGVGDTTTIVPASVFHDIGPPSNETLPPLARNRRAAAAVDAVADTVRDATTDVRLHTRAADAIFFYRNGFAAPEDVFGEKLTFFLNGMCATVNKTPNWAYAAADLAEGASDGVRIKRATDAPLREAESSSLRMPFVKHRARLIRRLCANATEVNSRTGFSNVGSRVKLQCGMRPCWEPSEQCMLDVSVDERLSREALDHFRKLIEHYNFLMYTSGDAAFLMQRVEDAISVACEDGARKFDGHWLANGEANAVSEEAKVNPRVSEVEFVARILRRGQSGADVSDEVTLWDEALVLLITMAQVGRFDDMSSEHGVATRLLFDERPGESKITDFRFVCVYDTAGAATSGSVGGGATAGDRDPEPEPVAEEAPLASAVRTGGVRARPASSTRAKTQIQQIFDIVEKFRKGKVEYFKEIKSNKTAIFSNFITKATWRVNYYKLARAIFAENTFVNRSVVSGRGQRLREAEAEKREALYFFQHECGRARKISRMYLPGS